MFAKIVRFVLSVLFVLSCVGCSEGNDTNPYEGVGSEKSAICETYPTNHPAYVGNCK